MKSGRCRYCGASINQTKLQLWLLLQRKNGKTWGDIADDLGVTRQALDYWLRGTRTPSSPQLAHLSQATGLSLQDLLP